MDKLYDHDQSKSKSKYDPDYIKGYLEWQVTRFMNGFQDNEKIPEALRNQFWFLQSHDRSLTLWLFSFYST